MVGFNGNSDFFENNCVTLYVLLRPKESQNESAVFHSWRIKNDTIDDGIKDLLLK